MGQLKEIAYACNNCGQTEIVSGPDQPPALCANCGDDEFLIAGNSNKKTGGTVGKHFDQIASDEAYFLRSILTSIQNNDHGSSGDKARRALITANELYGKGRKTG